MVNVEKNINKPECIVCKTKADFFLIKDDFNFYKCSQCGLVFVYPQPSKETIANDIYSEKSGYQGNKSKTLVGTIPTLKQEKVLNWLSKQKKGKLLDIGCSNGEFMWLVKSLGFDVVGVELNKRTADIARVNGLNVFSGFLEEANFPPASFDYIYMGDLIEHVSDPVALVKEVRKLLQPNGQVVIVTPNLDCFWSKSTFLLHKWFGIPWSSLTPPHHLFQFSTGNLNLLLSQEGFGLLLNMYDRPPRLLYELGSLHLLKQVKIKKTIFSLVFMIISFILYVLLYLFDYILNPLLSKNNSVIAMYKVI
ncbi:MAG: hypothetical protein A2566_02180 [Candidatus Zambryskibacteria bacterium RIFOXYD1_FULL_40_13]|nr:MAG: Methylase involved in ubiquinone/menaquinone biosynthesis [Parcubacteria group bacterium GW2011_GWC1_39_12]KKR18936.1 MAG: Methylase involved in ubiquinone/menaquinone biosynthesis [Parcubacteria group bacterium GW2011_GWF1_39_37]KKR35587.1 MAG: Methylase involved in ubiquinone/menaquinone biosynthesis [Parcubacteria group bacterium GW2011_GWC2_40_10]KKR51998.1 MAG: Methylase involved in ubiquinone/menaquinone biosynthesis [Parcubacteria group bacterium GW2011_GWE1_40_20]KKR66347.1 MAG: